MSCYFCDGGRDRNLCIDCLKNENKVNIWHLFSIIPVVCRKTLDRYDEERIIRRYYELKRKNLDIKEINHIIISEFKNETIR